MVTARDMGAVSCGSSFEVEICQKPDQIKLQQSATCGSTGPWSLDRKAGTTATGSAGVGIVHQKSTTHHIVLEVNFSAAEILQTQHVDDHLDTGLVYRDIIFLLLFIELKAVLEARTAAALNINAQHKVGITFIGEELVNPPYRTVADLEVCLHGYSV